MRKNDCSSSSPLQQTKVPKPLMAGSTDNARFLNPWVFHLQKMGLELKCPLCLNLLNRPILMPCDHIFCSSCIPRSTQFGSECPVCKVPSLDRDLRPVPHMENMVSIYRNMDAVFGANLFHVVSQVDLPDVGRALDQCPGSVNTEKLTKEPIETTMKGNSCNDQPSMPPLTANKKLHVSFHKSKDGVEKSGKPENFSELRDGCKDRAFGRFEGEEVTIFGHRIPSSSPYFQFRDKKMEDGGNWKIDMNQVVQTSPDSPPSFGDAKDLDDYSSAQGSEHSMEKFPAKGSFKRESVDRTSTEMDEGLASRGKEDFFRESKRHKKLNYGLEEMAVKSAAHVQSIFSDSDNVVVSNSESEAKPQGPLSASQPSMISDCSDANGASICVFCQSSRISEASGQMLHYANGKAVAADEANHSNVLHVHTKCIEWAPQVYFVGETVMNLEAEVARGSKLKCSSCGLKGAALGCYAKSCRKSFHVPCAVEISDCRWDCEKFLVLCPTHSSLKFPNERSKSVKNKGMDHSSVTQITCQQSNKFWTASSCAAKEWVLCGSALSAEDKILLAKFASMTGVTVSKFWKPNITHVIAATDEMGSCSRTLKVLMAILNGRWVLTIDWVKACLEAMRAVDEEPYEVSRDIHGCLDGPKNGRLRIMENVPKLFSGLNFYFCGDFVPSYKGYLQDLILAAGGTVLKDNYVSVSQGCDAQATPTTLVVYSLDPPQRCNFGEEFIIMENRIKEAEEFAAENGSRVIGHTWLLESIAACKLQSFAC
ncbi:hypothetical protein HHK36_012910 [Tetracentron sinense]|uniref:Uncharacterized protein n=1 Tax=Tetracentron sinense TaxID=13715 RepID=A0A835DJ56_TETSI|nr:hypothetical protein HHK36_012910 [Tetracentron sinense]